MKASLRKKGKIRDLSAKGEYILYRIAQEGINNVLKHAKATQIQVELDYSLPEQFLMTIRDNGVGMENSKEGFGLKSMGERAKMINGKVGIDSTVGSGTLLKVEVPL